jgi:hypothetical protein
MRAVIDNNLLVAIETAEVGGADRRPDDANYGRWGASRSDVAAPLYAA